MDKNIELLEKALAVIKATPKNHDQNTWLSKKTFEDEACGTTMCLGGHAAVLAGGEMPNVADKGWDGSWYLFESGKLATAQEMRNWYSSLEGERIMDPGDFAGNALGLDVDEKAFLFYFYGGTEALIQRGEAVLEAWKKGESFDPDQWWAQFDEDEDSEPCYCGCEDDDYYD